MKGYAIRSIRSTFSGRIVLWWLNNREYARYPYLNVSNSEKSRIILPLVPLFVILLQNHKNLTVPRHRNSSFQRCYHFQVYLTSQIPIYRWDTFYILLYDFTAKNSRTMFFNNFPQFSNIPASSSLLYVLRCVCIVDIFTTSFKLLSITFDTLK